MIIASYTVLRTLFFIDILQTSFPQTPVA